jgi:hypothetical protein
MMKKPEMKNRFRSLMAAGLLAAVMGMSGCAPAPKTVVTPPVVEEKKVTPSLPVELKLFPGDRKMTVQWKVTGDEVISGFDIFIVDHPVANDAATSPAGKITPYNPSAYPGDTNPDDGVEEFPAEQLVNGVKYWVWVRIVHPDGTLSAPTEVKGAVCGPRGEFELKPRFQSGQDGFSLMKGTGTKADGSDNDLYLYDKDGTTYLASPSRLNGYLHVTKFKALPFKGDLKSVRESVLSLNSVPIEDKTAISSGQWLWIVTADGFNALLQIKELKGGTATISYAVCPLAGEMSF